MGLSAHTSEYSDVLQDAYVASSITVGTLQVEAKVGANPIVGREYIGIYNKSNETIYYGPSGVTINTGIAVFKRQTVYLPMGSNISVYLIAESAGNAVVVQEHA